MAAFVDFAVVEELIRAHIDGVVSAPEVPVFGLDDEVADEVAWGKIIGLQFEPIGERHTTDDADQYTGLLQVAVLVETADPPNADQRRLMSTAAHVARALTLLVLADAEGHTVSFRRVRVEVMVEGSNTPQRAALLEVPFEVQRVGSDTLSNFVPQPD